MKKKIDFKTIEDIFDIMNRKGFYRRESKPYSLGGLPVEILFLLEQSKGYKITFPKELKKRYDRFKQEYKLMV